MAHEKLEWEFRLKDSVTGSAGHMSKSLHDVKGHTESLIHTFHDLEHIGEMTFEALEGVFEFGKQAFEAMEFKEHALIGLEAVTGSAKMAESVYEDATEFAKATGQSSREMIDASVRLTQAGYKLKDLNVLRQVLTDFKVTQGAGAMQAVEEGLVKMGSSGRTTTRSLMMLNSVAGLSGKVYQQLGKALHVSREQLDKMLEAGQVSGMQGADAVIKAEAQMMKGLGGTGGATKREADSVTGAFGQVSAEWDALMDNLLKPKDLEPLAEFIREIAHEGIPALREGFAKIAPTMKEVIGNTREVLGPGLDMKTVFYGIGEAVGVAAKMFEGLTYIVALGARAFKEWSDFTSKVALSVEVGVVQAIGSINDALGTAVSMFPTYGGLMIQGLVGGIKMGMTALEDAVRGLGAGAVDSLKEALGIHSPSKVFEELGAQSAAGFNIGVEKNPLQVDVPSVSGNSTEGGRRTVTFSPHVEVHVHSNGPAGATGAEGSRRMADQIVDVAMEKLVGMFEELQIEGGA
jgi:hypothetical protein